MAAITVVKYLRNYTAASRKANMWDFGMFPQDGTAAGRSLNQYAGGASPQARVATVVGSDPEGLTFTVGTGAVIKNGLIMAEGIDYTIVAGSGGRQIRFLYPIDPNAVVMTLELGSGSTRPAPAIGSSSPSLATATANPFVFTVGRSGGLIILDGMIMTPGVDYVVLSATQVQFLSPVSAGSVVMYI